MPRALPSSLGLRVDDQGIDVQLDDLRKILHQLPNAQQGVDNRLFIHRRFAAAFPQRKELEMLIPDWLRAPPADLSIMSPSKYPMSEIR